MAASPLGSARRADASIAPARPPRDPGPIWVLDDPRDPAAAACRAVAARLGMEHRLIPLDWGWRRLAAAGRSAGSLAGLRGLLPLAGQVPGLTLSAGPRAAAVAAWLKQSVGSRMVQLGAAGRRAAACDLLVVDRDAADADPATLLPVLGLPQPLSPLQLGTARAAWRDRLDHLPHPRLALLLGHGPFGGVLPPTEAFRAARALAAAASDAGGTILAIADARCGREAMDALAAGLRDCSHLVYRSDEPGPDPTAGFLACADVVVVAGNGADHVLQACANTCPIYVTEAGPPTLRQRRLHDRLIAAGQVRRLRHRVTNWQRQPLDEAGRVARAILAAYR